MWRGKQLTSNELRDLSQKLEKIGYYSVLLTFHSESPDYLIKSAAALVPGDKLKYMIALRPYHISPQYCAMLIEGYNQIESDRLMFNWIAGDHHNRPEEKPQVDVFGNSEIIDNIDKRKQFLRYFVGEVISNKIIKHMPEMIFSGYSDYTVNTANIFNSGTLCMLDDYRKNKNLLSINKRKMVSVSVIVAKDQLEKNLYIEKIKKTQERALGFTIVGSPEEIKKQLVDLEKEGITDVLLYTNYPSGPEFFGYDDNKNDILVNTIIKEILEDSKVNNESKK